MSDQRPHLGLCLFMTKGMSLGSWAATGMLDRELAVYRRLREKGVDFSMVSYGGREELSHLSTVPGAGICINRFSLPQTLYSRLVPWLARDQLRSVSVVKSNQVSGGDIALSAARRYGKKYIARCGYLLSEFNKKAYGQESMQAKYARQLEKRIFNEADRVVVTTGSMSDIVSGRYGVPEKNIEIIPNYVDTEKFCPNGEEGMKNKGRPKICFIGRLVEQKNLFDFLLAMQGIDADLLIIGEGHLRNSLVRKAKRLGVNAEFLGNVPHYDLPDYLRSSAIFVLPSLYEGHPKVLLEAMACGIPVIGTDVPGNREVITNMDNGILCELSVKGIHDSIIMLLKDDETRHKLGSRARKYIENTCSLDVVAEKEYALLAELLH